MPGPPLVRAPPARLPAGVAAYRLEMIERLRHGVAILPLATRHLRADRVSQPHKCITFRGLCKWNRECHCILLFRGWDCLRGGANLTRYPDRQCVLAPRLQHQLQCVRAVRPARARYQRRGAAVSCGHFSCKAQGELREVEPAPSHANITLL